MTFNSEQLTFIFGVIVIVANVVGGLINRASNLSIEKRLTKLETIMQFVSKRLGFPRAGEGEGL